MENKLMIFENEAFGKVRTLNLNGEPWFRPEQSHDCSKPP